MARKRSSIPKMKIVTASSPKFRTLQEARKAVIPTLARILATVILWRKRQQKKKQARSGKQ